MTPATHSINPAEASALQALPGVRILIVGDVMLDRYWFGEVSRISPEAPVPIVRIEKREERLGGAANVARNASALGAKTALLGVVGADEAGNTIDELLAGCGIESFLQRDANISTIIKLRVIGRQQQLVRIDFEEAPTDTVLRDKLTQFNALLPAYDLVVLSDYAKGSLVNVGAMIAAARAAGKTVLVDPKGDDFTRYKGATLLTPNKSEFKHVMGGWSTEEQLTAKAQQLRTELDLDALLLTRSEEGMTLYTAGAGAAHAGRGARGVRRLRRRRYRDRHAGVDAGGGPADGRRGRHREPRRRHRGRQARHGDRHARGIVPRARQRLS
jgi:rfaE bifunctional protein kinase chain/domain